jgi:RNA recognition motif-containing protein
MPDGQPALAAIAALNGKEFMGRPLNVSPARPKPEVERDNGEAKKIRSEIKVKGQEYSREKREQKDTWYSPVFNKKRGRYKTGRRLRSFMKRRAASGIVEEVSLKRESRENPMRWRKKHEQPKPWQKSRGELKPRKKTDGESKPWRKTEDKPKSWRKSTGGPKPSRKSKRPRPRQSQTESRRKPGGYTR